MGDGFLDTLVTHADESAVLTEKQFLGDMYAPMSGFGTHVSSPHYDRSAVLREILFGFSPHVPYGPFRSGAEHLSVLLPVIPIVVLCHICVIGVLKHFPR